MASAPGKLGRKTAPSPKTYWITVRVRIEAQTEMHLKLAAKEMGVEIKRIRMISTDAKTVYFATGTRKVEVK